MARACEFALRFQADGGDFRVATKLIDLRIAKQDDEGRFYAESISRAWSAFDFAQKKAPSPWITLLALRVIKRVCDG